MRQLYDLWKAQTFAQKKEEEIKVRDLIMSSECLHLPNAHYACTICWLNQRVHKEPNAVEMRKHCYHAHSLQACKCHDPITLALSRMIGQDVMLSAVLQNEEKITVRGNYQQCYHRGCQEKSANGVGTKIHMETKHHSSNTPDMGAWDIVLDHLNFNEDTTLADFFGEKQAFIYKHKGCGYVGITEKAMMAHDTQQHQSEAAWERATLTVQLGVAAPPEGSRHPVKQFNNQHEAFLARKDMTLDDCGRHRPFR
jgi:hypothetical protein